MNQEPQKIEKPNQMARGTAILYPKPGLETGEGPHFSGMTVLPEGERYWIEAYIREVNKKTVLELNMSRKWPLPNSSFVSRRCARSSPPPSRWNGRTWSTCAAPEIWTGDC